MENDAYVRILAQIADNAPASITVHDFSGTFLYANEATFRLHGYTREEFLEKTLREIDAPQSAVLIAERMEELKRDGEAEFEVTHIRKDGSEVPLHVLVKIVKWEGADVLLSIATDLTERKRADAVLREREELLNATQQLSRVGGWVWDVLAQTMSWTEETYRIHDIDPGGIPLNSPEHITKSLACYAEGDRDRIRESFRQCADNGVPYDMEVPLTSVAGRQVWVRTIGRPVFQDGRVVRVIGSIMDITDRKRSEEALQESEAKLQLALDGAGTGMWEISIPEMRGTIDKRAANILGYNVGDIDSRCSAWDLLTHPDDLPDLRKRLAAYLDGHTAFFESEHRMQHVSGEWRWVIGRGRASSWQRNGSPLRISGTIMDITDRKQSEEALRQSEERYRLIAENTADYIWIFDLDLNLTYISPAVRKIRGFSAEEAIAQSLDQVLTPESLGKASAFFREELAREAAGDGDPGRKRVFETEEYRRDGSTVLIENTVTFLRDAGGAPTGILGISRDITVRKRSDEDRESLMRELSAKNAELERFTYTVSHDLKSPLITIRGFLGFLEEDMASGDLQRLREDISRIDSATEKIQQLIDALLELSRIGRIANPHEWVPLSEIAGEAADLLEGPIQARGVPVLIAPDLPVVYADRPRLREVFTNLIENAVKFMGDQQEPCIRIETRGESEGYPVICIRDNGIGIDPAHHEQVFSLFSKLDPVTPGTGIGLSLVRRIIDVHGGRIWLESEGTGKGSTFCFTFPKRPVPGSPESGEDLKY